ncbi:XAC0095 family protein [Luteimonas sp. R10]|uniref:XAC0095 family protein n=1 Tax=Luteimonas sp. R10 TaxID=3108176 RepID=UPI00309127B9|nr:hypothetical protein U3649_09140 [Luteimonas sp. R10]
MSKFDSDDLDTTGYFLPEDSQFRLTRLRDHIRFLGRLAQPRMADEAREWAPEVSMGELAFCLESLAEQVDLVLEEVSWPALRDQEAEDAEDAAETAATPEASEEPDTTAEHFAFGVTLDQIDEFDRLIQAISAHGDVLAAGQAAGLADHTLPQVGQAILDGVTAVRAILDEVEAQQLGHAPGPSTGVGEERGVYRAGPERSTANGTPGPALPVLAYRPTEHTGRSRSLRLH